jgi:hypothetical protein
MHECRNCNETAQFHFWEYINRIFGTVYRLGYPYVFWYKSYMCILCVYIQNNIKVSFVSNDSVTRIFTGHRKRISFNQNKCPRYCLDKKSQQRTLKGLHKKKDIKRPIKSYTLFLLASTITTLHLVLNNPSSRC